MFDTSEANCLYLDPELFFPESEKKINPKQLNLLIKTCATCSVFAECRKYSIENAVEGFWAGTTFAERQQYRKENGIIAENLANNIYLQSMTQEAVAIRNKRLSQKEEQ